MKVSLFKNVKYGFDLVREGEIADTDEYVRISEYVDVEFPPLPHDEIVQTQVKALVKVKTDIQAEAQRKITEIDSKLGELLALPQSID